MCGPQCTHDVLAIKAVIVVRIPHTNMIPNHGMTCTKSTVLNVAKLTDLDVSPIHIPTHARAAILPSVASPRAADETLAISNCSPLNESEPPGLHISIERIDPRTLTPTIRITGAPKVL